MIRKKILIMGAAGRDFHNFNVVFRDNPNYEIVCFTATQIPGIEGRRYPPLLAGKLYPNGIPIEPEENLPELIKKHNVTEVIFAYSDVSHNYVMHRASIAMASGADFKLLSAESTMIPSTKKVISVCASRTGCGKSQTSRKVADILKSMGIKFTSVRHPMPYGNLEKQICQRFATMEDLNIHECTIEEREEYEPHIMRGNTIYAGVDYGVILRNAEKEADVIIWDGGNNDLPFFKPDLEIVVVDPHRSGHEDHYHPGETNVRRADVIVINKMDSAKTTDVDTLVKNIKSLNKDAIIIKANSKITVDMPEKIKGKRVLVVEDGPTLTHGGMTFGAGTIAAERLGAGKIVDPRPYVTGRIKETYEKYPKIGVLLPAMGYSPKQVKDLETVINTTDCDLVIVGTPIDLRKIITINKEAVRVEYELDEIGEPNLTQLIKKMFSI